MSAKNASFLDSDIDLYLKISNYEETVKHLDIYYGIVKRQLLRYQSAITGLFPVLSDDEIEASVRDSIYCAAAVWSLFQAYRRIDDDRGKSYELGQSAVKCMRGILACWIRQADQVERFKKHQCNKYALHSKFNLKNGDIIYSDEGYPHLQVDVVSLYLIYLVQMTTSGLQIIYTKDEVAFVQNLVYYIERAYRTPDYAVWGRGSSYNDNTPEIHASSIGMAKSALESINGCNLFGDKGASWSVIYVDIDAHNRNRSIFETLLPRESSSKAVDSALLSTVSYPAFATHEEILVTYTKANITKKLKSRYGFKRFKRDGYKCAIEDPNRQYYKVGETQDFENIENEWPMFFLYMIIDGVFKNLPQQIEEYKKLLKDVMRVDSVGDPLVPMFYYVTKENVDFEKANPGSQLRSPGPECDDEEDPPLFLWNQALYIIAQLLTSNLLHINELDPIRRYLPSYNRPKKPGRYSAFQGTATDLVVQVVLIAESMRLQAMMATYGIQTQTPHEVEPVQIWSSTELVKVYQHLGVNKKLNLSGRPLRPIGALGTSKMYRVCGMTVLCYPLIFEVSEFYLYRDMSLLIDDIKTELQFVSRFWRLSGRPTVCLLIREEHMRDPQFEEMLDLFAMLKKGHCDGIKVRIGRLQNLLSSSCMEHLDFMNNIETEKFDFQSFKQLEYDYSGYQSLTDVPKTVSYEEDVINIQKYIYKNTSEIIQVIRDGVGLYSQAQLYGILLKREGLDKEILGASIRTQLTNLYHTAGCLHYWIAVRYCSSLLRHTVDSISPFITTVLVNGKQLTVGVIDHKETVFDKPMTPDAIDSIIYSTIQPYNVIQAVLQQEIILYCGRLIGTHPDLFKGILKIRVGWVLEAMKLQLKAEKEKKILENLSPYAIRQLLQKILTIKEWTQKEQINMLHKRMIEGCWCRVPNKFYNQVWDILVRTPRGIRVLNQVLPQRPTINHMTHSELQFGLFVENMLIRIQIPEYRQLVVELLCIVSTILIRNPELTLRDELNLDNLIIQANLMFCKDNNSKVNDKLDQFISSKYSITTGYLARAVVNNILTGGQLETSSVDLEEDEEDEDKCKVS
ncbi:probable phosphorylase b kinase regulatory subunit beta isoform X2 [Daktulosphaira vitifoliae]|uniref:probable phosphorylase b kinase regulatory subunit beta isoform X2 n=1 Tax=Daktulosphaira vitifoliae TaxID=58002 RepID=UPI0021A9BD4D|nr:probable phosphorylase b kinase regulatory subunit beta isoform X2 [Daktulosphaira vitifoliae]